MWPHVCSLRLACEEIRTIVRIRALRIVLNRLLVYIIYALLD